jgi:hypothetical protein
MTRISTLRSFLLLFGFFLSLVINFSPLASLTLRIMGGVWLKHIVSQSTHQLLQCSNHVRMITMKPYCLSIISEKDPPRAGGVFQVLYCLIQGPTHSYAFVQEFSKESILCLLF